MASTAVKNRNVRGVVAGSALAGAAIFAGHAAAKPKEDIGHLKDAGAATVKVARIVSSPVRGYSALAASIDTLEGQRPVNEKVIIEPIERRDSVDQMIDIFYPGVSGEGKKVLHDQINITKEYMKDILPTEAYQNIANHEQLFSDIEKYSGVPQQLMQGLACAESRGGVDALSSAGAVGPYQISDAMWEEAGNTVMGDETDGRYDWDESAKFTAEELAATNLYFATKENPNWGLAAWRWHMGRRGVREQIENYSASHGQSFTDLREYIRENKITVFSILQIKNIREALEEPGYDQTPIYVLRIAACASILEDMKNYEVKNVPNQS